jgi:hypothetical protein
MTPSSRRRNPPYLRKLRHSGSSLDFGRRKSCGVPGSVRRSKKIFRKTQLFLAHPAQGDMTGADPARRVRVRQRRFSSGRARKPDLDWDASHRSLTCPTPPSMRPGLTDGCDGTLMALPVTVPHSWVRVVAVSAAADAIREIYGSAAVCAPPLHVEYGPADPRSTGPADPRGTRKRRWTKPRGWLRYGRVGGSPRPGSPVMVARRRPGGL